MYGTMFQFVKYFFLLKTFLYIECTERLTKERVRYSKRGKWANGLLILIFDEKNAFCLHILQ